MESDESQIEIPTMMLNKISIETVFETADSLFTYSHIDQTGIIFEGLHFGGAPCMGVRMQCN